MLEEIRKELELTVAPLVRGIVEDSQKLFRQELALVKVELREDARRMRDVVILSSLGVGFFLVGLLLLGGTVACFIYELVGTLPLSGALGFAGALFLVVGGVLLIDATRRAKKIKGIPEQAVQTMRENVEWIQRRV
jgi:hypothetical protein